MIKVARILAWSSLVMILVFTDGPLAFRPETPFSPNIERFTALLVVGTLFGFAYPRRILVLMIFIFAAISFFELLQFIPANRHGSVYDVAYKSLGAMGGLMIGKSVYAIMRKLQPSQSLKSG